MVFNFHEEGNWRALRHRNFRILYVAAIITNIGSWAQRIAQDWLVLQLTHNNGTYLGVVTALQFGPTLFFSMKSGVLADRVDKRRALVITNLGMSVSAFILGVLVITRYVTIHEVFILAFLLGSFSAIDAPIRQSFTVEMVGKKDLTNAMSLNSANFHLGRLIGPAISGFLIAAFGTGPSFLINGVSYIAVIISLMNMRIDELHDQEKVPTEGNLREAFAYLRNRPDLQVIMATVFFVTTFGLNTQIFNALMATKEFHRGSASYGLLGTAVAIGSLTGALVSARFDRTKKLRFVSFAAINFGIWVALQAFAPNYYIYALILPLQGFSGITSMVAANSIIQANSAAAIRGRIMGIYMFVFMGATPVGAPLIGWASEHYGTRPTIVVCGLLTTLPSLWLLWRYRAAKIPNDISVHAVLKSSN